MRRGGWLRVKGVRKGGGRLTGQDKPSINRAMQTFSQNSAALICGAIISG